MRCGMLLLLTLLIVLLSITLVAMFAERDGQIYRLAAKVVYPISKRWVSAADHTVERPFSASLQKPLPGWRWFQPQLVDKQFTGEGLQLKSQAETVWWKNQRGTAYLSAVTGNVEVEVTVRTRKQSDTANYPDQDYQFGGIMLRNTAGNALLSTENYVFNVIGYRGQGLQVESKSTLAGYSDVSGYDWPSGNARVRIVRKGSDFYLYAAAVDSQDWVQVNHFNRPDLPDALELGLIAYAYSYGAGRHDLQVTFSDLLLR